MSPAAIRGGLGLRLVFVCTGSLPGHVTGNCSGIYKIFLTRLLLIWVLVVAHEILL
jgi:hypothetical protein